MSILGNPIMIGGSSGSIELITRTEWNSLTDEQKQAKGLIAIQDSSTGYSRGELVSGINFEPFKILQSGAASSTAVFSTTMAGEYYLYVIALNSEASTYELNITATQNGVGITGDTIEYHQYYSSGYNRRNYRITRFLITVNAGDTGNIQINLSNRSSYSGFVYALINKNNYTLKKSLTTADKACSGTHNMGGFILYGTFSGSSGAINVAPYTANDTVTTAYPGTDYKSAYIFWFT